MKRWGKSPPRDGQPDRHGKPHREQCQIGGPHGRLRSGPRVGSSSPGAIRGPEEWSSRAAFWMPTVAEVRMAPVMASYWYRMVPLGYRMTWKVRLPVA